MQLEVDKRSLRQTLRKLKRLEFAARRRVTVRSVRKALKPLVDASKAKAPRKTGLLAKSLRASSVSTDRRTGAVTGRVTGRGTKRLAEGNNSFYVRGRKKPPKKQRVGQLRYLHMVVQGTRPHRIPGPVRVATRWVSNVSHPGARGNDFFWVAAQSASQKAVSTFTRVFGPELEKEAKKR